MAQRNGMDDTVIIELLAWESAQPLALAVRFDVFVQEQGVPPELERDELDATSLHAVARFPDGSVVGTGRLLPDGHIGRMAVADSARGQGIGGRILEALVERAAEVGHHQVVLNAQCHAQPFYMRHGFVAEGPIFDDAGIDHISMTRTLVKTQA